jgi:uncharacterized membrane protein YphA (DoxX/SURF4 family)
MRAILVAIFALLAPVSASAHELWFVDPQMAGLPERPEIFTEPTAIAAYLIAATAVVFVLLVGLRNWGRTSPFVHSLEKRLVFPFHARQVLAILIGVDLVWSAIGGTLFAPNLPLPTDFTGELLKWFAVVTGLGFIFFEYFLFECSLALLALFLVLGVIGGPNAMLQQILFAGSAIFLGATAPRTWFKKPFSVLVRQRAYIAFRILAGVSILAVAMVKWLHPELGMEILHDFPVLNFMSGLGMDDATFLFCAALVETLGGLALIFNLYTRWFAMLLVPMFTLTAFVLGQKEVIGHLPIQGMLAVFVLYGHTYTPKYKTHIEIHGKTTQAFEQLPM